jgi:hypothetical protein
MQLGLAPAPDRRIRLGVDLALNDSAQPAQVDKVADRRVDLQVVQRVGAQLGAVEDPDKRATKLRVFAFESAR